MTANGGNPTTGSVKSPKNDEKEANNVLFAWMIATFAPKPNGDPGTPFWLPAPKTGKWNGEAGPKVPKLPAEFDGTTYKVVSGDKTPGCDRGRLSYAAVKERTKSSNQESSKKRTTGHSASLKAPHLEIKYAVKGLGPVPNAEGTFSRILGQFHRRPDSQPAGEIDVTGEDDEASIVDLTCDDDESIIDLTGDDDEDDDDGHVDDARGTTRSGQEKMGFVDESMT
jgi:hypothetical protein